jgi:hypothetical protein
LLQFVPIHFVTLHVAPHASGAHFFLCKLNDFQLGARFARRAAADHALVFSLIFTSSRSEMLRRSKSIRFACDTRRMARLK